VLDETDSGLDIDALKVVAAGVNALHAQERPEMSFLLITHYQRILNYIKPDHVHVMMAGRIVRSGGFELAEELEAGGYEAFRRRCPQRSRRVFHQSRGARRAAEFFSVVNGTAVDAPTIRSPRPLTVNKCLFRDREIERTTCQRTRR
jgi:ABC-type multidrug transport system ATPase subunit